MKKIGIDLTSLKADRVSGIEVYARNIASALMKINLPDIVLHFYFSRSGKTFIKDWFPGCQVHISSVDHRVFNEQVWLPAQKLFHQLDMMYFPGYPPSPFLSKNSIITLHDTTIWDFPSFASFGGNYYYRYLFEYGIRRARTVITVSKCSKVLIAKRFNVENITVVPNALDSKFLDVGDDQIDDRDVREKLELPDNYILFVGTIEPRKNLANLIAAFLDSAYISRNCSLVLAGRIAWGGEVVEQYKNRKNIIFTGFLDQQSIAVCYKYARFVILPSFYEGFGLPVLESFYFNKIVCCSYIEAFKEVAADGAIFFDPANIQSISDAIKQCYSLTEEQKQTLVRLGKGRLGMYSWEDSAKRLSDCFIHALNRQLG
jgi:glycosyltransferase involved in cell wall biosynthesis